MCGLKTRSHPPNKPLTTTGRHRAIRAGPVLHHDFADGDQHRPASGRLLTLLLYLSEPPSTPDYGPDGGGGRDQTSGTPRNGATYFPALNMSVTPTLYSALLWSNVSAASRHGPEVKDLRVLHGSAPIERGPSSSRTRGSMRATSGRQLGCAGSGWHCREGGGGSAGLFDEMPGQFKHGLNLDFAQGR